MGKKIVPLSLELLPDYTKVVGTAFYLHEPITSHITLDEAGYLDWTEKMARASLMDGFSCAVLDDETGSLIGGLTAHRMSNDILPACNFPQLQPVVDLLCKMTPPRYVEETDPSLVLELFMIGGLSPAQGGQKGIVDFALKNVLQVAKERGIRYLITDLTSPITQHVCIDKFGFKGEFDLVYGECGIPEYKTLAGKAILGVYDLGDL